MKSQTVFQTIALGTLLTVLSACGGSDKTAHPAAALPLAPELTTSQDVASFVGSKWAGAVVIEAGTVESVDFVQTGIKRTPSLRVSVCIPKNQKNQGSLLVPFRDFYSAKSTKPVSAAEKQKQTAQNSKSAVSLKLSYVAQSQALINEGQELNGDFKFDFDIDLITPYGDASIISGTNAESLVRSATVPVINKRVYYSVTKIPFKETLDSISNLYDCKENVSIEKNVIVRLDQRDLGCTLSAGQDNPTVQHADANKILVNSCNDKLVMKQ